MCTLVIVLAICGRMSTLLSAVTVPVASSIDVDVALLDDDRADADRRRRPAAEADDAGAAAAGHRCVAGRVSSQPCVAARADDEARSTSPAMTVAFFMRPRL